MSRVVKNQRSNKRFGKRRGKGNKNNQQDRRLSKIEKQLKDTIELKIKNVSDTGLQIDNTGLLTFMSGISQGLTVIDRIGESVKFVSADIRISGSINDDWSTGTGDLNSVRIVFFRMNQNIGGATLVSGDVFSTATGELSTLTPLKYANRMNYQILRNWVIPVSESGGNSTFVVKDFVKIPPRETVYTGSANTQLASRANHYYMWITTNVPSDATPDPPIVVNRYVRLRYVDA